MLLLLLLIATAFATNNVYEFSKTATLKPGEYQKYDFPSDAFDKSSFDDTMNFLLSVSSNEYVTYDVGIFTSDQCNTNSFDDCSLYGFYGACNTNIVSSGPFAGIYGPIDSTDEKMCLIVQNSSDSQYTGIFDIQLNVYMVPGFWAKILDNQTLLEVIIISALVIVLIGLPIIAIIITRCQKRRQEEKQPLLINDV